MAVNSNDEIVFRYNSIENMQNVIRALDLKASFLLLGLGTLPITNVDKFIFWLVHFDYCCISKEFVQCCAYLMFVFWVLFLELVILTIMPQNLNADNSDYQERKASIYFATKPILREEDLTFNETDTITKHLIRQQVALGEILSVKRIYLGYAFKCLIPITIMGIFLLMAYFAEQNSKIPHKTHNLKNTSTKPEIK